MTPQERFKWTRRAWGAVLSGAALLIVITACVIGRYVLEMLIAER